MHFFQFFFIYLEVKISELIAITKTINNIIINKFLINSWISYCKGNTSILALQNIVYKTINDN